MNIQNIMKQAQQMQKELTKKQGELNQKIFPGKYSLVDLEMNGTKKIVKLKLKNEFGVDSEDWEMLEESLIIALNQTMNEIDKASEEIMSGLPKMPGGF